MIVVVVLGRGVSQEKWGRAGEQVGPGGVRPRGRSTCL